VVHDGVKVGLPANMDGLWAQVKTVVSLAVSLVEVVERSFLVVGVGVGGGLGAT